MEIQIVASKDKNPDTKETPDKKDPGSEIKDLLNQARSLAEDMDNTELVDAIDVALEECESYGEDDTTDEIEGMKNNKKGSDFLSDYRDDSQISD